MYSTPHKGIPLRLVMRLLAANECNACFWNSVYFFSYNTNGYGYRRTNIPNALYYVV